MCGICGIYQPGGLPDSAVLKKMTDLLEHRGPDDEGYYTAPGIGLGHRRLSIIDLEGGHQPLSNEDGSVWVAYNGEIYNYQELFEELKSKGHVFRTHSDTEAIVHLYEEYGCGLFAKLTGMFAIALWDSKTKKLLLGRDRAGQKPLYYAQGRGVFLFASEIKSILAHPAMKASVNLKAVRNFLNYQYVPAPDTAFEGIYKLPAASYLIHNGTDYKIEKYWSLDFSYKLKLSERDICIELRNLMNGAVKSQLVSDVPLGAFLSGGIDSGIIVGLMSENTSLPVKTFSIGFDEEDFNELKYAKITANHFNTEHREFTVRPNTIEILPKLIWHYNEPFADPSALPTYYVAKMTREYVTVALCGDAGDENFAGYRRYLMHKWAKIYQSLPALLREKFIGGLTKLLVNKFPDNANLRRVNDFRRRLSIPCEDLHSEQMSVFSRDWISQLYAGELLEAETNDYFRQIFSQTGDWECLDRVLWVDINSYLPDDLLIKADVASMANSLEVRSPFLDHHVMEFAAKIPAHLKVSGLCNLKYILRKAFAPMLPPAILKRGKMGFSVPINSWFKGELKGYIHEILLDEATLKRGYFKREGIERLLFEHCENKYDHSFKLWNLLILELWLRMFIRD